ncbi:MAG: hypothetical protein ABS96_30985 [Lysobacteraceae bacterium SCN 69-123]|nr:MAG: hypothetical protein ABS96_30985 [Xanthomonadaceae bacterium SCN 69-123]
MGATGRGWPEGSPNALPGQGVEIDIPARQDHSDLAIRAGYFRIIASGTAQLGSMTILSLSQSCTRAGQRLG